jgi:hypothetical protein
MNGLPPVSPMIAEIRNAFRPFIKTGRFLSAEEVYFLLRNLNNAHAVAIEIEDEFHILQRHGVRSERQVPALGENILRMRIRPRLTMVPTDGGDAA